jgi:hypothetical protein
MLNRSTLPLVHAAQLSVLNDSYAGHAAPDAADSRSDPRDRRIA